MNSKALKLSVIIPAYNEERQITACLDALMRQTEAPDEIIVVDNNCTDRTVELAQKYRNVKVVSEKTQGLIAARNKGFRVAKGDILCRIDADSVLVPDWCLRARRAFAADDRLDGITGVALTRVLPRLPYFRTRFYAWGYFWAAGGYYRTQVLWGANMAIRKSAWTKVSRIVCLDDKAVHEDQDLTLCLLAAGGRVKRVRGLEIITEGQVYHYFPKLREYIGRCAKTRNLHEEKGTWPTPKRTQFSRLQIILRLTTAFLPCLLFFIGSFLYWPLDRLMLKYFGKKEWLGL